MIVPVHWDCRVDCACGVPLWIVNCGLNGVVPNSIHGWCKSYIGSICKFRPALGGYRLVDLRCWTYRNQVKNKAKINIDLKLFINSILQNRALLSLLFCVTVIMSTVKRFDILDVKSVFRRMSM